jgi:hypothetical protein
VQKDNLHTAPWDRFDVGEARKKSKYTGQPTTGSFLVTRVKTGREIWQNLL